MSAHLRAATFAAAIASIACGTGPTAPAVVPRLSVTKILAFGDSLTEGEATPSSLLFAIHPTLDPGTTKGYPYKLLSLLSARYTNQAVQVYNGGYGGRSLQDDATNLPPRTLQEFIDALHPDVMILMHGANDLNAQNPNVQTIASYAGTLVAQAQSQGIKVIVSSLPPRIAGGTPDRGGNPQLVVPFNTSLASIAAQRNAPYVNVYTPMIQSLSGPDIAPDGLHLTQAGNDKLAGIYFTALQYLYETIR